VCLFCRIHGNGTIGKKWKRVGNDSSRIFNMASWPEKQLRKWLPMRQQEVEPQPVYCALKYNKIHLEEIQACWKSPSVPIYYKVEY